MKGTLYSARTSLSFAEKKNPVESRTMSLPDVKQERLLVVAALKELKKKRKEKKSTMAEYSQ